MLGKKAIPAAWEQFDGYGGDKSTYLHAFSEYIDNSIASYQKEHKDSVKGLRVFIEILTTEKNGITSQEFTVVDNAGGMDDDELYEAIIPDNRRGKSDTQLNQYGIGMKLATFWFARSLKIVSKRNPKHQYGFEINITDQNLQEKAVVDIQKNKEDLIKIGEDRFDSGTYIKVFNIRTKPNRILTNAHCEDLKKGLGWRYSDMLNHFELTIRYRAVSGKVYEYVVLPFKIKAFQLSRSIDGLSAQKNARFNPNKYKTKILSKVKRAYERDKQAIDAITDKNFYETLENDKPLYFSFKDEIEGKTVKIEWGILALNETKDNAPYKYIDLEGLTLINNGRAIMHGPNLQSVSVKGGIQIGTYTFSKRDASSGQHVFRRLFGRIDLTGVENADRNKTMFVWGSHGQKNLDEIIQQKICKAIGRVLNEMYQSEVDGDVVKKKTILTTGKGSQMKQRWSQNFDTTVTYLEQKKGDASWGVTVKFGNGNNITFNIVHCNANEKIPFEIESNLKNDASITIRLNDDHYLWKDYIRKTDNLGQDLKINFIYPLAIAFAICKIYYDDKNMSPFSSLTPDKLPSEVENAKFEEVFESILAHIRKK